MLAAYCYLRFVKRSTEVCGKSEFRFIGINITQRFTTWLLFSQDKNFYYKMEIKKSNH
jgi:hypothetical protein